MAEVREEGARLDKTGLPNLRKHLGCYGICREGYDKGGDFSSVWECVEMDTLLRKALSLSELEVVRSRT